jgi:hypothetical protein
MLLAPFRNLYKRFSSQLFSGGLLTGFGFGLLCARLFVPPRQNIVLNTPAIFIAALILILGGGIISDRAHQNSKYPKKAEQDAAANP